MSFPLLLSQTSTLSLSDLLVNQETIVMGAIISGAVIVYGLSKIGDIKSLFGYFVLITFGCIALLALPQYQDTAAGGYAEETLEIMLSLLRSLIAYLQDQILGLTAPIGGIF